jgi:pyruvate dehydrogenase E1 component alpha subunit
MNMNEGAHQTGNAALAVQADKANAVCASAPEIYRRLSPAQLRAALHRMHLIRRFEESAEEAYTRGLVHGTMHLSIGQEASAVGACMALSDADYITSTHRGHGHCIAKGADVARMFAEFFGKEDGYCRGRGGSMHIADVSKGNLGANGIVGGGIPIAVGVALSIKMRKRDSVVISFFGDGANNEGAFHEALNMASVWKLPVIFFCENNQYGMSTSTEQSTAVRDVAQRASAYAMPGVVVDGNRFAEVTQAVFDAVELARRGGGPSLIESKTYRIRGHSRSDRNRYRSKEEIESWRARDPIVAFESELMAFGLISDCEVAAIHSRVEREIAEAIQFAKASPAPNLAELTRYVYTD